MTPKTSLPAGGLIIRDIQVVQDSGAAVLLLRAELSQLLNRFAQSTASDHIQDTYSAASLVVLLMAYNMSDKNRSVGFSFYFALRLQY